MAGLLPQDEIPTGLLGDPRQMAMLSAAAALLEGGGPSLTPTSLGQNLGRATMAGMNSYQQGLQMAQQNALMKRQFARQDKEDARSDRALDIQEQRLQQGADDPSAVREWQFYSQLSPQQQNQYLEMKRALQLAQVGGVQNVVRPGGALQPLSTVEQEATAKEQLAQAQAEGAQTGKATVEARSALPKAEAQASQMLTTIELLRNHPGKSLAVGASSLAPVIPGTDAADFVTALDQAQGQLFLQAYQDLKGSGQITEVEGKKAEQAIARLSRTQSEQAFDQALVDLESVVKAALGRAQSKAGVTQPQGGWSIQPAD